jgi:hypothetical protein
LRLIGADEAGTLQAFKVINAKIAPPVEVFISVQSGRHRDRHSSPMVAISARPGGEAL